jgi:hypothetical protein
MEDNSPLWASCSAALSARHVDCPCSSTEGIAGQGKGFSRALMAMPMASYFKDHRCGLEVVDYTLLKNHGHRYLVGTDYRCIDGMC